MLQHTQSIALLQVQIPSWMSHSGMYVEQAVSDYNLNSVTQGHS